MSKVWNFFTIDGNKAKCNNCPHANELSNN